MNRMSETTAPTFNKNIGIGLAILSTILIGGSIAYSSYFLTTTATDWSKIQSSTLPIFATTIAGTIIVFISLWYGFSSDVPPIYMLLLLAAIASISVGMSYSAYLLTVLTKAA